MTRQNSSKKNVFLNIFIFAPVFIGLGYLIWFSFSSQGLAAIHSDQTAGIQKMEEALNEHRFLPFNWYYANTMNIPWGMEILILFYGITRDYIITLICYRLFWTIVMLIAFFIFGKRYLKLAPSYISFVLCSVLAPISALYYKSMYIDGYNRRILIWFILLMLGLSSLDTETLKIRWKCFIPFCLVLMAFMIGDSRYIAVMIVPMIISMFACYIYEHWKESIRSLKIPGISFLIVSAAMIGCILGCHGIERYFCKSHDLIGGYYNANILALDNMQDLLAERTITVVREFMEGFGYIGDSPLVSRATILSFSALVFMLLILLILPLWMLFHFSEYHTLIRRLIIFRWTGYFISVFFGVFGLDGVNFRHFLPFVVLDLWLAVYCLSYHWMTIKNVGYITCWTVMILYLLMNWAYIPELAPTSLTDDRYAVIDELKNRGLTYGYGEYWSASVIQTFSNDELRILPCLPEDRMEWYCPKELYLPADAEESTFYITDVDSYSELETDENFQKIYGDYTEKLEIGNYVVLIYNYNIVHNFHEYRSQGGFNLVKYLYSSAPDARDSRNAVYIAPGEYVYGPYMILDAGDYKLHVEVNEACDCKVYSHDGEILPLTQLKAGENILNISIDKDDTFAIEVWIQNTKDKELIVEKVVVE